MNANPDLVATARRLTTFEQELKYIVRIPEAFGGNFIVEGIRPESLVGRSRPKRAARSQSSPKKVGAGQAPRGACPAPWRCSALGYV
jgi:hypothetical protein